MAPLGSRWYEVQIASKASFGLNFTDGSFRTPDLLPVNGGWFENGIWSQTPSQLPEKGVSTPGQLKITEVGVHLYSDTPTWLEVQNLHPTETAQLGKYHLRSMSLSRDDPTQYSPVPVSFHLPDLEIPPGGHALIMGKAYTDLPSGPHVAMVLGDGRLTPFWQESGLVELLLGTAVVDCIRFGSSPPPPSDPQAWVGAPVPSPYAVSIPGAPPKTADQLLGWSLTRDASGTDSNSPSDWTLTPWATPGGPGDVLATSADGDLDGLPDSAESPGGTFAGLPLYLWGARTGRPDIFIHLNYMDPAGKAVADEGITPRKEALDKVVTAFQNRGIGVHFDTGNLFGDGSHTLTPGVNPAFPHKVPFALGMAMGSDQVNLENMAFLYTYKNRYLPLARRQVFHYLVFANTQNNRGTGGSSGVAELQGNDFMVTLGGWELSSQEGAGFSGEWLSAEENLRMLINIQASTIMHELGHNLGLYHGGSKDENYKPNYLSIMNYAYQLSGLPVPGSGEAIRYYWSQFTNDGRNSSSPFARYFNQTGMFTYFGNIPDNEASLSFRMDYSEKRAPDLTESLLWEPSGLGLSGSEAIDFNGSGTIESITQSADVNDDRLVSNLEDHDDWGQLKFIFQRNVMGVRNGATRELQNRILPILYQDRQPLVVETLMPRRATLPRP